MADPHTIIRDFERQHIVLEHQVESGMVSLRVLADIGERFLSDTVNRDRDLLGHIDALAVAIEMGIDAGTTFKLGHQELEGSDDTCLQCGRAQISHDPVHCLDRLVECLQPLMRSITNRDIAMALDPAQVETKRGQHAAHIIVHVARNIGALSLDRLLKMVGQGA